MTLNDYQEQAQKTALGLARETAWYPALGLAGEAGELVEVVKKFYRDHTPFTPTRERVLKEAGDVLWYLSQLVGFWDLTLQEVAWENLAKLADRQMRGVLQGSGEER